MSSLRPKSLTGLALVGFSLVALPLVIVIVMANVYLKTIAHQSEQLTARGVWLARESKELEEKIVAMERNARQYQVLGDRSLVDLTIDREGELDKIITQLERSRATELGEWHLDKMREDSLAIIHALHTYPPKSAELAAQLDRFGRLRESAEAIRTQGDQFINNNSHLLQTTADNGRRLLMLMAVTLIPAVILISLFFTVLIAQPIRQIEEAIKTLGKGGFSEPIDVGGPRELQVLSTRLEWLRRRLTTLEEDKNRFLRHMSHELKTPLSSIREGAELLTDGSAGSLSDMQREIATILRKNSLELQFLIENLLDFEEWREKSSELEVSRFSLRPLISAIVSRHQLFIASKQLQIDDNFQDIGISADRERIRMTLDNLVSNAVKYSPAGGTVYIRTRLRAESDGRETAHIDIADTGPGIPKEERSRIFDAFYQGRHLSDGYLRGTGIGLSVVRDCVHAHGGKIEIIEGEYPGAHFRIQLPSPPQRA